MKKIFSSLIGIFTLFIILSPVVVNANIICNDGTVSKSCTDCHKGCCSGHGGCTDNPSNSNTSGNVSSNNNTSSNGNSNNNAFSNNSNSGIASESSSNTNKQPIMIEKTRSSDISLKSITVNNDDINVSDNMVYSTTEEKVKIYAKTNDDKATVKYSENLNLVVGDNVTNITVTAENGNKKEYQLNIIREKILSNNTNIKIIIDGKEISFDSYNSETIYLSSDKDKIDIEYKLEDSNSKAEIIGNENLKAGDNEVIVQVKAENGESQEYTININKYGKIEETVINVISIVITIFFFGSIGFLIYFVIKKILETIKHY